MSELVAVATADEIPVGRSKRVAVRNRLIAIFNVGESYCAIEDTCTHDEASLADGELFGEVVECPLHGARFNVRSGKALSLPAVYPVKTFPVHVEGDTIKVEL